MNVRKSLTRYKVILIIVSLLLMISDLVSKLYAVNNLEYNVEYGSGFILWRLIYNFGFSFSFAKDYANINIYILPLFNFIISGILYFNILNAKNRDNMVELIGSSLIIAGALGNALDRLYHGYVVDFISIRIFDVYFPAVFNLADIYISSGVVLVIYNELIIKRNKKK